MTTDPTVTIPMLVLLGIFGSFAVWSAKMLWKIDRRLVRMETKLGLKHIEGD